jgi:antitoxin (DNA-binding transcriptional repressor) of toxin-antitoxin stability system
MTVSEARAALPQVVASVLAGDEVTLTRHGRAVAVVVRPDRLRSRRVDAALEQAQLVSTALEKGRAQSLSEAPALSSQQVDTLLAEARETRRRR